MRMMGSERARGLRDGLVVITLAIAMAAPSCRDREGHGGTGGHAQPGSAGSAAETRAPLPDWIEVRVGRVRLTPIATPWDGPKEEAGFQHLCALAVETYGTLHGQHAAGELGASACGIFGGGQRQTDPTLPDLQVRLIGGDAAYVSDIAFDQTSHTFDYAFAVPSSALTDGGLTVSVIDADDGTDAGQEIGSVRITKDALASAIAAHQLESARAPGLDLLEYEVRPYDGTLKKQVIKLDPAKGGATVTSFTVSAGDVVRIEAQGTWKVGGLLNNPTMGTAGFPGGGTKDYNLKLFPDLANGAAVAIVGRGSHVKAVGVNPCTKFVAPYAGTVSVGINDRKPSDNTGSAQFTVFKRGASASQWRAPGTLIDCD